MPAHNTSCTKHESVTVTHKDGINSCQLVHCSQLGLSFSRCLQQQLIVDRVSDRINQSYCVPCESECCDELLEAMGEEVW